MRPGTRCAAAALVLAIAAVAARPEEDASPAPAPEAPASAAILDEAARRQGTADLSGERAVRRFLVRFREPMFLDPERGDNQLDRALLAFATPRAAGERDRVRCETEAVGETTILGHTGRVAWLWTAKDGAKRFTDPDRDRADLAAVEDRRRLLRLGLGVFFVGNLRADAARVKVLPDEEEATFPTRAGKPIVADCRVLERAADPDSGEPALRLYLRREGLDPVAASFPPEREGAPGWLMVLQYDAAMERGRKPGAVPVGIRVPNWIELFEVPAAKSGKPVLRVQAGVDGLEIGEERVPDALFDPPKPAPERR